MIKKLFGTFFGLLLVTKVGYLIAEMYYNGHMLDLVTTTRVTKDQIEGIETLGHNLTSFGLTVLIAPLFYYLVNHTHFKEKYLPKIAKIACFIGMCVVSYSLMYTGLEGLMTKIVESQKNKRYASYYVNALKYGIIGGHLGYETFVPKHSDGYFNTEEKVLLANIFLLTHIDKTLINRLVEDGAERMIDVFIEQNGHEDYLNAKKRFDSIVEQSNNAWGKYQDAQKRINATIVQKSSGSEMTKTFNQITRTITDEYNQYAHNSADYEKKISRATSRRSQIFSQLKDYFKYRGNSRAERKYSEAMKREFGHYVDPSAWCKNNQCPSEDAITDTIKKEAAKAWQAQAGNIPPSMSKEAFLKNESIRAKILYRLEQKGLVVDKNFDFSAEQFATAYAKSLNNEKKAAVTTLINRFENEAGIIVKLSMDKKDFIDLFEKQIAETIQDKNSIKKTLLLMLENNKDGFYDEIYRPAFKSNIASRYFLTQEDFEKPENAVIGDAAIKMLYIPPFAIAMSLLAAGLNLVTVISMVLTARIRPQKAKIITKSVLIIVMLGSLVYFPYQKAIQSNFLTAHEAISKTSFDEPWGSYITLLNWVVITESFTYEYIYPIVRILPDRLEHIKQNIKKASNEINNKKVS